MKIKDYTASFAEDRIESESARIISRDDWLIAAISLRA
jgi:hypothetical protein